MRSTRKGRAGLVVFVLIAALTLSGCGGQAARSVQGAEAALPRPGSAIEALKKAIDVADTGFPRTADELLDAVDNGITTPSALQKSLNRVPSRGLSAADDAVVAEAKEWAAAYASANAALKRITGLEIAIPEDAVELLANHTLRPGTPEFNKRARQVIESVLYSQTCAASRELIDAETAAVAGQYTETDGPVSEFVDVFIAQSAIETALSEASVLYSLFVDVPGVAAATVAKAKAYADGFTAVIESPNSGIMVANMAHLGLCVIRD